MAMPGMMVTLRQIVERSWFALLTVVVLMSTLLLSTPAQASLLGGVPASTYAYYVYLALIFK
jgi:hypothetical protein